MFIVPADEIAELMAPEGDHLKVIRRFAAIRVQAIGETDAGLASGLMADHHHGIFRPDGGRPFRPVDH